MHQYRNHFSAVLVVPFLLIHLGALAAFFVPFRFRFLILAAALYFVRMFFITAGYHRYFSHRTFKLSRPAQFLMAFMAETSGQKGVLWWAAHHRRHHQFSDQERDVHSPMRRGFWWAHVGWVISDEFNDYDANSIKDFSKFPEIRFISTHNWLPPAVLAAACLLIGGWSGFVWGFLVSTTVLYHGTFSINSLAHLWGSRRFPTPDDSRNNFFLAAITMGEGWHNNHHQYMYACRQGMHWWEIDATYYIIKILGWVGIAHDIRERKQPRAEEYVAETA